MKKILAVLVSILAIAFVLIGCSEPKQYKIAFVSDEETVFSAVVADGSEILMPQTPTKDGYEFIGWENNGEIVTFPYKPTNDITFNAVWTCLHEWKQVSTTSTCEEAGVAFFTCAQCDEIKQEDAPALGHDFIDDIKEPTCKETGYIRNLCSKCGYDGGITETIDKLLHTAIIIEAIVPTCENTGLTAGMKCSECDEILAKQEIIPALGHKANTAVKENESNATCAYIGSYDSVVYCAVCEKELSREKMTVEALVHTGIEVVFENVVDATCTKEGTYDNVVYCTVCNEELSRKTVTVDKLLHTAIIIEATAPTCENTGLTAGAKCSECDEILAKQEIISALGHKASAAVKENAVEATCADSGSYDNVVYCAVCEKELSREAETVDKLLHTAIIIEAIAPTCENTGLTAGMKCSECDEILVKQEVVPTLYHKWGEWLTLKENSCTSDGEKTRDCAICGKNETEGILAAGHKFELTNQVEATCISGGYDVYKCKTCGALEQRNPTAPYPLGHNYKSVRVEPTCVNAGYVDKICSLCGNGSGEHKFISALGHTYERVDYDGTTGTVIDEDEGIMTYYCQDCDESYSVPYSKYIDTKTDKSQKWSGKTLDCLAESWGGGDPAAWDQPELYVKGASQEGNLGTKVNDAVWARQMQIQKIYGVTMVWHKAMGAFSMQNELQTGIEAGYEKFHIATPRGYEMQSLIAADTVYDLANSKYIDLTKSYYNQAAVDSFTVYGHTFFVAGDFSYLDEYTSSVIFYNQAISEKFSAFGDLYKTVKDGKWTIARLAQQAQLVGADDNGSQGYQDTDTYGYGATSLTAFFQSSGIKQVSVDKSSGDPSQYNYHITLNDPNVPTLITELANIKASTWARTSWDGSYGAMHNSFTSGKLLFYDEIVQKIFEFPSQSNTFKVGVLPKPMLNEEQGQYYTPFASQSTVMCVPKATVDREMSEYFFDVLSWTGQDYVMRGFYDAMESRLYDDGESSRDDALEILRDYVFNNLIYDPGYISTGMSGKFLTHVQSETIAGAIPSSSPFTALYSESYNDAYKILNDEKNGWNTKAKNYKE